jgi:RND family efflux transporter MFP subunit
MDTSDLLKQLRIDKGARVPRARTGRLVLAGVALLTLAGGLLWLTLARSAPPTVRTATARAAGQGADGGSVLDASGYVTARRQATVSAKVTGKVTEVLIEEGMRVEEGAILARLDDTEAKAQLALARAQLAAARSQVAEIRAQLDQAERDLERQREIFERQAPLATARAQLAAARAQAAEVRAQIEHAEREYERHRELFERQLVAAQALEAARAQRDALRARLTAGDEQVRVAQEAVAVAEVNTAQAVETARAQRDALRGKLAAAAEAIRVAEEGVAVAEVQVANTVIRAPFSGIIVAKTAQPGEMISPMSAGGGFTRTGIGTLVDMDSLEIQVDVNEAFINRVKPGQPVEATLNAYPDSRIPAEVIAIIPTADRSKATVKVRIALKQKDPRVVPEMGARVQFLERPRAEAPAGGPARAGVLVPAQALRPDGDQAVVFVYAEGKVERRKVTPGQTLGTDRQVLSGLRPGERVVVSPPDSLRDGAPVKLSEGG